MISAEDGAGAVVEAAQQFDLAGVQGVGQAAPALPAARG